MKVLDCTRCSRAICKICSNSYGKGDVIPIVLSDRGCCAPPPGFANDLHLKDHASALAVEAPAFLKSLNVPDVDDVRVLFVVDVICALILQRNWSSVVMMSRPLPEELFGSWPPADWLSTVGCGH